MILKRKVGRPKLPPDEKKYQILVSMKGYDWRDLEMAGNRHGMLLENFLLYATREYCKSKGFKVFDPPKISLSEKKAAKKKVVKRGRGRPPKIGL